MVVIAVRRTDGGTKEGGSGLEHDYTTCIWVGRSPSSLRRDPSVDHMLSGCWSNMSSQRVLWGLATVAAGSERNLGLQLRTLSCRDAQPRHRLLRPPWVGCVIGRTRTNVRNGTVFFPRYCAELMRFAIKTTNFVQNSAWF